MNTAIRIYYVKAPDCITIANKTMIDYRKKKDNEAKHV